MSKVSKYLIDVLDDFNDYNLANLWLDITKQKVICVNIENLMFYHLNTKTFLWQLMGSQELSSIIQSEIITYLTKNKDTNTDKRLDKALSSCKRVNKFNTIVQQVSKLEGFFNREKTADFMEKLDSDNEVINFKNGCFNLKYKQFRQRTKNDFFTKCLNYDYTDNINENTKNEILKTLKQICNDDDKMFEFMMSYFGYSLTGETKEQKSLFTIGLRASNGKSTFSKIFESCFQPYVSKVSNNFLKINYSNFHKEMAELKGIRYVYIEELPKNSPLDVDLYKDIVDGNHIRNNIMFGTSEYVNINFKLNILTNHIPKFENDKGILRRGLMSELHTEFLDEENFKNKKGTYLLNKDILKKYTTNEYKQALFDILKDYAFSYYKSGLNTFKELTLKFKEVCDENDLMGQFIESEIIKTDSSKDRIHRDDFLEIYNNKFKLKKQWNDITSDVKRLLTYDCEARVKYNGRSQKKCILNVKWRDDDDDDDDMKPLQQLYPGIKEKDDKIRELENEIKELKLMIKENKEKQMKDNKEAMKPQKHIFNINEMLEDIDENPEDDIEDNNNTYLSSSDSSDEFEIMKQKTIAENKKIREAQKHKKQEKNKYYKDYDKTKNEAVDDCDGFDDIVDGLDF